jgi:hypothetical protein
LVFLSKPDNPTARKKSTVLSNFIEESHCP